PPDKCLDSMRQLSLRRGRAASVAGSRDRLTAEGESALASRDDWTIVLRRQRMVRVVEGKPHGVYINSFEIICRDCGDNLEWDYDDIPPRLQRIRGPYWIETGLKEYEAHSAWHTLCTTIG